MFQSDKDTDEPTFVGAEITISLFLKVTTPEDLDEAILAYSAALHSAAGNHQMLHELINMGIVRMTGEGNTRRMTDPFDVLVSETNVFSTQEAYQAMLARKTAGTIASPCAHHLADDQGNSIIFKENTEFKQYPRVDAFSSWSRGVHVESA